MPVVNNMSDLRALPVPAVNKYTVELLGFYNPGDGGGGLFVWNSTSTLADDQGIVIQPNSLPAQGRWFRVMEGWDWNITQTPASIGAVNPKWFGAVGNGQATALLDTLALQQAIVAAGSHGTNVEIVVPDGKYGLTTSLKLPASVKKFVMRGETRATIGPDSIYTGAVIYCRYCVGVAIDVWNAVGGGVTTDLGSFALKSLVFDGANGDNWTASSITCTGIVSQRPQGDPPPAASINVGIHIDNVLTNNILTSQAIAFDISRSVDVLIENSYIAGMYCGYAFYSNSSYIASTNCTLRKVYVQSCTEILTLLSNNLSVECEECIFESALIGIASFLTDNLTLRSCWFENIGYAPSIVSPTTAFTLQNGPGSDPVNTAFGRSSIGVGKGARLTGSPGRTSEVLPGDLIG